MARVRVNTLRRRAGAREDDVSAPTDVRVMNLLAVGCVLIALVAASQTVWASMKRASVFNIGAINVDGDLQRTSVAALRGMAAPKVAGNFFAIDLADAKAAFEAVPWVRRAHVRRLWPNGLRVTIEEHRAVALWETDDADERLLNEYGEVFEANTGEVEDEKLPTLGGPSNASRQVLVMHQRLLPLIAPLLAPQPSRIDSLHLTARGSWQLVLPGGAQLELGRGTDGGDASEVLERTARFVRTFAEVSQRFGHPPLMHADLRHTNGYALQLKGVAIVQTTGAAENGVTTAPKATPR